MPRTLDDLRGEARRRRLPNVLRNLERLASPGLRVSAAPAADEDRIPLGASKFWGRPDLPASIEWPLASGRPLAFLGQLDMAVASPLADPDVLPAAGLLYFFYDLETMPTGLDPAEKSFWRVLFQEDPSEPLRRVPVPEEAVPAAWRDSGEGMPEPLSLSFETRVFLPSQNDVDLLELGLPDDEDERLQEWLDEEDEKGAQSGSGDHRLLGRPFLIRSDMRLECQLASNGVRCGDGSELDDPRAPELARGAGDWRLLLQRDSDPDGVTWGDGGMLYFWIRYADLRSLRFENAWCILQ